MTTKKQTLHQPRVFQLAFFTAMFERFGFYLLSALLVLFVKSVFHLSDSKAFVLFGVFTGLVYITPAIGGYLADHVFGIRRCIIFGLFLEGLGLGVLSIPNNALLGIGLALIILGVGFFKTAPTDLMARSYEKNDPRIDSGFTLFYMAINIGSFGSIILAGFLQTYIGWHGAFLVASLSLWCSLLAYFLLRRSARGPDSIPGKHALPLRRWCLLIIGLIISVSAIAFFISHAIVADIVFFAAAGLGIVYFIIEILKSNKTDKKRILVCLALILIGFVFYLLYYQAYTSINLFVDRVVDRHVGHFTIPTVTFIALNPFWILVLSPIFAMIYGILARRKKDFDITTKFSIGLLLISICFLVLTLSAQFANKQGHISPFWLIVVYLFYSVGELLVGALGVAMVTHIAPKRLYGVMMGSWFFIALGLSASSAGIFAGLASVPENVHDPLAILHVYAHAFLIIGIVGLIASVFAFAISPYLRRIAKLNH